MCTNNARRSVEKTAWYQLESSGVIEQLPKSEGEKKTMFIKLILFT